MSKEAFDKILEENIGKQIEISIVHHVEGITLRTKGELLDVTEDVIVIFVSWREHFWSLRKTSAIYKLNRKAASILSVVIYE